MLVDGKRILIINCVECNKPQEIAVKDEDLNRWLNGDGYVQDIFPYLTAAQREMLMSKICGECWDRMFKDDDEDYGMIDGLQALW